MDDEYYMNLALKLAAKGRGKDYFQLVPVYKLMDIVTDHRYSFTNG